MAESTRVTVTYLSAYNGLEFSISFHVAGTVSGPTDAIITAMIAKINACTRAYNLRIEISKVNQPTGSLVVGADYISEDKGQFRFVDSIGIVHRWKIPGPLPAIFDDDDETIDLDNTLVDDFTGNIILYAIGAGGDTISAVVEGHRTENRKKLKR